MPLGRQTQMSGALIEAAVAVDLCATVRATGTSKLETKHVAEGCRTANVIMHQLKGVIYSYWPISSFKT